MWLIRILALLAVLLIAGCTTTEGDIPWGAGDPNETVIGIPGMNR